MNYRYCGKMIYTEQQARSTVRHSKGELKGVYYCKECDGFHTTKHQQTPTKRKWFEQHPKKFRNKHT